MDLSRVKDPETLRTAAQLLERENRKLLEKVLALQAEVAALKGQTPDSLQLRLAQLEEQLAQRNHKLFGDSSERRPHNGAKPPPEKPVRPGHGPRAQPALPLVEVEHVLDDADRACPQCGGALEEMTGQYEESEEIDVVERRFVLKRHKRKKYRCGCNACVETALGPAKLKPGARYSIDFAIEVAVAKYADHAPLERQVRIMAREGLVIDSQTLWDQIDSLAKVLRALPATLKEYLHAQPVLGADETRWRMLSAKGKDLGEAKQWQVWGLSAPKAVCYAILDSRSTEAGRTVLGGYRGIVMADGYGVYGSLSKEDGSFTLVNCWAHVRRKYLDIESFFPTKVGEVVGMIGELYAVEREAAEDPDPEARRARLRAERSREIIGRIHRWALETEALPQSGLRKAIEYMGSLWKGLTRFLEDPRIPLDNNASERALRGPVVGRKNHYGSQSRRGTEVAALFYSAIESAKLAGVEPKAYLRAATHAALQGDPIPLPHTLAAAAP